MAKGNGLFIPPALPQNALADSKSNGNSNSSTSSTSKKSRSREAGEECSDGDLVVVKSRPERAAGKSAPKPATVEEQGGRRKQTRSATAAARAARGGGASSGKEGQGPARPPVPETIATSKPRRTRKPTVVAHESYPSEIDDDEDEEEEDSEDKTDEGDETFGSTSESEEDNGFGRDGRVAHGKGISGGAGTRAGRARSAEERGAVGNGGGDVDAPASRMRGISGMGGRALKYGFGNGGQFTLKVRDGAGVAISGLSARDLRGEGIDWPLLVARCHG